MAPEDLILLSEISQSQKNISMVWFQWCEVLRVVEMIGTSGCIGVHKV
jgi:hypothetical protein